MVCIPPPCSEIVMMPISVLIEAEYNPREITEKQLQDITNSLTKFGFVDPIHVNMHPTRQNIIVGGHQRVKVARAMGIESVPTTQGEWTLEEEKELNVRLNQNTGSFDREKLFGDDFETPKLIEWGFEEDYFDGLDDEEEKDLDDVDPQEERAEELRELYNVELGQVWQLGEHRLMCGDSADKASVEKLLAGDKPNLMVTDPPYGVEYDPGWRAEAERADGVKIRASSFGKVENDGNADWSAAYLLFHGNVAYVWHPSGALQGVFIVTLEGVGFQIRSTIIWNKSNFAIGRGHYHKKYEPCLYAVRKGETASWIGDRKQCNVWDIPKAQKNETRHSTQKPLECMLRPIRNHASEYVYDPFCGSGTTIIACENMNRKCLAMELSPNHVAVSIQRWVDVTGGTPELVEGAPCKVGDKQDA